MIRPMSGITRYILKQLAWGMVMVAVALTAIMWLTQSLRFIKMIVSKGLSVGDFVWLTILLMPSFLVFIVPLSLFTIILYVYNRLTQDRELVVMRSAGLSHWGLARPALILAAAVTIAGYILSLWVIPWTVRDFHKMQWSIANDISDVLLRQGVFNRIGSGLTIYVRERTPSGELLGLLIHDKRHPKHPITLMAEKGALVYTSKGPRVLMINGNRQELQQGTGKLSLLYFKRYTLDFASAARAGTRGNRDAREMSLTELFHLDQAKMAPGNYRRAVVELNQRFSSPLDNMGLALLALGALLPAVFDRRGNKRAMLLAIGLMMLTEAATLGVSNLATANLSFVPLMYVAAILPIVVGIVMMNGIRPRRWLGRLPPLKAA